MKTKAIIFDFDGTLTKPHKFPNSWARLWHKIGCQEEDDILYGKFNNKEITYDEWLEECLKIFRRERVCKKDFQEISKDTSLVDFFDEYMHTLANNNVSVYVLSGGIGNVIECKLENYKKQIKEIICDKFKLDEHEIVCGYESIPQSLAKKSKVVYSILEKDKLSKDEVVFIGNGANDEEVYLTGVKTICVNPDCNAHPENKTFWKEYIKDCNDIRKTLNFID